MRLVDPCRRPSASVLPVGCAASSSRSPAASLRTVLGEGRRLPAPGAPRRLELLFQMLATKRAGINGPPVTQVYWPADELFRAGADEKGKDSDSDDEQDAED